MRSRVFQRDGRDNASQLAGSLGGFALLFEQAAQALGAPNREVQHLIQVGVNRIERAEVRQQRDRRLGADTGNARNIVHGVTDQRLVIEHLRRCHAELLGDGRGVQPVVLCEIPDHVIVVQQLGQVLVGADNDPRQAETPRHMQQGADVIVGLVFLAGQVVQPDGIADLAGHAELVLELLWRRFAVGLVGRVNAIAERGGQAFIKRHGDVSRRLRPDQPGQHVGKPRQGIDRPARCIGHRVGQREPRTEDVNGCIDQVDSPVHRFDGLICLLHMDS